MKYDRSHGFVKIRADELSSLAVKRGEKNALFSLFSVCDTPDGGADLTSELSSFDFKENGREISLCVSGNVKYTDGEDRLTVLSNKKVRKIPDIVNPAYDRAFFALSAVNAFIVCSAAGRGSVRLVMSFEKEEETASCCGVLELDLLSKTVGLLISRALPLITLACERGSVCRDELAALKFPYGTTREGQRDLMIETMRVIRTGDRLLACAPTGIGKTVSVLYPALKSVGAGLSDKIFYLTSKGLTGKAASDLLSRISNEAPHLRSITLEAKENLCPGRGVKDGCFDCPLNADLPSGDTFLPVEYRLAAAAGEVCARGAAAARSSLLEAAEKYRICPHELSLKVSEFCDVIICDYNYAFDGEIKLRRYFGEKGNPDGEKYVFLVDEAHNLPDRIRDTYSASLKPTDFGEIFDLIKSGAVRDEKVEDALGDLFSAFADVLESCDDSSSLRQTSSGEALTGYSSLPETPPDLYSALVKIKKAFLPYVKKESEHRDAFRRAVRIVSRFIFCSDSADGKFRFLAERENSDVTCSVLCLDPSSVISSALRVAHSTVMFSATLSPKEYFTEVTGFRDEEYVELDSPFDPSNLSVMICDSVSTRLSDRKKTAPDVAELVAAAISGLPGKYLVYFPSFEYLNVVLKEFLKIAPDVPVVAQKSDMTGAERNKFVSLFSSDKYSELIGFSVLGGTFSEGIDLSGDSLIGVIVVGAGLTGISSSLNMISEYYDEKYEKGYEFSYLYPAVNRLQQAVGRVIRSEDDRGIALLIDSRLGEPSVARLFPTYWHPIKLVSDPESLSGCISDFWRK
ncbi:MAG: ATP-dependent DNA helicase [Clostridia bacterium]|nr:ATP-dependent DNA helicase [Clostridia bacterium]